MDLTSSLKRAAEQGLDDDRPKLKRRNAMRVLSPALVTSDDDGEKTDADDPGESEHVLKESTKAQLRAENAYIEFEDQLTAFGRACKVRDNIESRLRFLTRQVAIRRGKNAGTKSKRDGILIAAWEYRLEYVSDVFLKHKAQMDTDFPGWQDEGAVVEYYRVPCEGVSDSTVLDNEFVE